MRTKVIFALAGVGLLLGLYSAYVFSQRPPTQPPAFNPAANPYEQGIYANGIIESAQSHGANINIYAEVPGTVVEIAVAEGDTVRRGDVLVRIDDSVQRAVAEQQKAQSESARALLEELRAQPRPEVLDVAKAQLDMANATLKSARDQLAKQEQASRLSPGAVSLDVLDNARNGVAVAGKNVAVVRKQFDLARAGAWSYDILNQERQWTALGKAYAASAALLSKYTIRAPVDGVVLSVQAAAGSYVSPAGVYDTYTQGVGPLVVMGTPQDTLEVRCYVDEILVARLPAESAMSAKMFVRGTDVSVPLTFQRIRPYVSPKIELADQRQERVDVRVLPVIFRFTRPGKVSLYPGQLVDVYIGTRGKT